MECLGKGKRNLEKKLGKVISNKGEDKRQEATNGSLEKKRKQRKKKIEKEKSS